MLSGLSLDHSGGLYTCRRRKYTHTNTHKHTYKHIRTQIHTHRHKHKGTIMFFNRLTSGSQPVRSQHGVETSLHSIPFPPLQLSLSLSLSIFLPSLRNKSKTKLFPVNLKTVLEVVLSELKICNFHHYVQKIMHFLQKYSHSLKLEYPFRAQVIFQFTHQQRRAVAFELGNVVKTLMVTAIPGRC